MDKKSILLLSYFFLPLSTKSCSFRAKLWVFEEFFCRKKCNFCRGKGGVRFVVPDPAGVCTPPEPGDLALGITAAGLLDGSNSILPADAALQGGDDLLITDGLHGGGFGRDTGEKKGPDLVKETLPDHDIYPGVDPLAYRGGRARVASSWAVMVSPVSI